MIGAIVSLVALALSIYISTKIIQKTEQIQEKVAQKVYSQELPKNHNPVTIPVKSHKTLTMEVTAYCLNEQNCADGSSPGPGTVAVDPNIIPLGSKLFIPGYGHAIARDTGSDIRGHRLDIWLSSRGDCIQWGRRSCRVILYEDTGTRNNLETGGKIP